MIAEYACPVCDSQDWAPVQKYVYHAPDHLAAPRIGSDRLINLIHQCTDCARALLHAAPKPERVTETLLNSYERQRREVLFNVWFPDADEVTIASRYCWNCGFMAYSPRPEEHDIQAKYAYLAQHSRPDEIAEYNAFLDHDPYSQRSRDHLHALVDGGLARAHYRILDCGGASGWYLVPFVEQGCICELVDYETGQLPGITKVGDSIHDLTQEAGYDAIVCRAVLEHLANPHTVVDAFHRLLNDDGVLYAMVPGEIYAGTARLGYDPVTHINFFTPNSFASMFRRRGFEVEQQGVDEVSNLWVLARKRERREAGATDAEPDIGAYLYPSRATTVRKYIIDRIISRLVRRR